MKPRATAALEVSALLLASAALTACGGKDKATSQADDAPVRTAVAGTISLESGIPSSETFVLRVTTGADATIIATAPADADGRFSVPVPGALAVPLDEPLVVMSRTKDAAGLELILWSFATSPQAEAPGSLNVLSSVAYEVAVLENDLAKGAEAMRRTAALFGVDAALEQLDPKEPKLTRLGKLVTTASAKLAVKVSVVHKAMARDVKDGTLDGLEAGTAVVLAKDGAYALLLTEVKAVLAGNDPKDPF